MVSLAHPSATAELALMVDASAEHVGASLQQQAAGGEAWQPLGFFSKNWSRLRPAIRPLAGSYGLVFPASGISAICWRAGSSFSSQTASR
jgi:hypothetical protein